MTAEAEVLQVVRLVVGDRLRGVTLASIEAELSRRERARSSVVPVNGNGPGRGIGDPCPLEI